MDLFQNTPKAESFMGAWIPFLWILINDNFSTLRFANDLEHFISPVIQPYKFFVVVVICPNWRVLQKDILPIRFDVINRNARNFSRLDHCHMKVYLSMDFLGDWLQFFCTSNLPDWVYELNSMRCRNVYLPYPCFIFLEIVIESIVPLLFIWALFMADCV